MWVSGPLKSEDNAWENHHTKVFRWKISESQNKEKSNIFLVAVVVGLGGRGRELCIQKIKNQNDIETSLNPEKQ